MGSTQEKRKKKKNLPISSDNVMSHKAMELPVLSKENQEINSMVIWLSFSVTVQVQENPNEEEINNLIYRYGYIMAKEQYLETELM